MAFSERQLANAASLGLFPFGDALVDPTQIAGIKPDPNGGVIVVFRGGGGAIVDPDLSIDDALEGLETALAAARAAPQQQQQQ